MKEADTRPIALLLLNPPPRLELDRVINEMAWQMAKADCYNADLSDMVVSMKLELGAARYKKLAMAAYKALLDIDCKKVNP